MFTFFIEDAPSMFEKTPCFPEPYIFQIVLNTMIFHLWTDVLCVKQIGYLVVLLDFY